MRLPGALALSLAVVSPAMAQTSPAFPTGRTYIIELSSSQGSSGLGNYLVPPLTKAFNAAGMRYRGDAGADFAATVQNDYDVGKWHAGAGGRRWLYTRTVTVGLSPAAADISTGNRFSPHFAVSARILTPDADRVDELNCLIALATRELAARYKPKGRVAVDGGSCLR